MQARASSHLLRALAGSDRAGARPPRRLMTQLHRLCLEGQAQCRRRRIFRFAQRAIGKARVWPVSAAICSRRRARSSACRGQHSTAAQLPERRHCSALHKTSRSLARTMTRWRRSLQPQAGLGAGTMGRGDQHDTFACAGQRRASATAGVARRSRGCEKDFAECRIRPAASGQERIQHGMSGRLGRRRRCNGTATPDAASIQQAVKGDHGRHEYGIQITVYRYSIRRLMHGQVGSDGRAYPVGLLTGRAALPGKTARTGHQ